MSRSKDTTPDLDLDTEIAAQARKAAIAAWNRLAPDEQAKTDLNRLIAKHRRALERRRLHPTTQTRSNP